MNRGSNVERAKSLLRRWRQPLLTARNTLASLGRPRSGTLVYVGLHRGQSFDRICRRYERCLGFEANPEMFAYLQRRYRRHDNVRLFNVAVTTTPGEVEFNISSNDGMSSSLGHFDPDWEVYRSGQVRTDKVIRVPGINLLEFLRDEGIAYIDDYISDIQGMDLEVLRTLRPMLEARRIGSIQCEVARNEHGNVFHDLGANDEQGFAELLEPHYELVARGWGLLRDGQFDEVPADWWEMDCKWRARSA